MEATTMRNLAELIVQHHRVNRNYNRTGQYPAVDTTVENDSGRSQRFGSGDAGCDTNSTGQSGNNFPG